MTRSSTVPRTILISQLPLDVIGGGELFTIRSFRSLLAANPESELWYSTSQQPTIETHVSRMKRKYVRAKIADEKVIAVESKPLRELLNRTSAFDAIAVHQYLSCSTTINFISAAAPDQTVVLTSLGHEPFCKDFVRCFEPGRQVRVAEISEFAAKRSGLRGITASAVSASVFHEDIVPMRPSEKRQFGRQAIGLGRQMPHKGFEVTIDGIPEDWNLRIVGPPGGDRKYLKLLKRKASRPNVELLGCLGQQERVAALANADVLIASSCRQLFDGREIDHAELFGLVILEALAVGVLPVVSDVPSFCEIMEKIGLNDLVYQQRDSAQLSEILLTVGSRPEEYFGERLQSARDALVSHYLWDNYWERVFAGLGQSDRHRSDLTVKQRICA